MMSFMKLAMKGIFLRSLKHLRYHQLASKPFERTSRVIPGHLPVYVGEEKQRFVIPTSFLYHPLFSMLLERAYREYGFEQTRGLMLPCDASIFQEVVSAVKSSGGQFDLEKIVNELNF